MTTPNFLKSASEKDKNKGTKKSQKMKGHKRVEMRKGEGGEREDQEIPLPSWIPGLSGATFEIEEHLTAGLRMQRQNADPLVGLPDESGRRNYIAASDMELDPNMPEFRKWDTLKKPNSSFLEYSMFVRGFVFDEVMSIEHPASNGNIPY